MRRFAREGAHVLVAEIDDQAGESVAGACRAEFGADVRFVHTDASARSDVTAMVSTAVQIWGTVDILVNNAWGGGTLGRFESMTDVQMQWALSMGLLGPFWGMQAVLPIMKANRGGAVINLCSLNGVNAHMGTTSYNVAKEALRAASRTAAREWAAWQIRVNIICPGAKSAATREVFAAHPELEAAADTSNPMGRLGDPEEDIARWPCSWPARTPATSPATRSSWTVAVTSTASCGRPTSATDRIRTLPNASHDLAPQA